MLVVPLLEKYKKYLMWSYRTLGFFQTAGKFSILLLLMILFNLYELAYYVPEVERLSKFQTYLNTYWFNLGLMAAEALALVLLFGIIHRLVDRRSKFNLINLLV